MITNLLLESGARVLDKALLYRKVAQGAQTGSYSDTEIRALSQDVDLLLEVTFVPNPRVPEGYDVGVKAVRTRDAAVLALTSSAGMPRSLEEVSRFVPVAGVGYEEKTGVRRLSLDALCSNATDDALHQVALRY